MTWSRRGGEPLKAHDLSTAGDVWASLCVLFREIRRESAVALSGESADEVFGGYPWYHVSAMLSAPTYPWAAGGSWEPLLRPDVARHVKLASTPPTSTRRRSRRSRGYPTKVPVTGGSARFSTSG
jgi:asparagine synthetase B (glutamine-hydrolysing)